jgi:isopropylmalate/homocitrate/citramalate synthase
MKGPWEAEKWHISHLNFLPEVQSQLQLPQNVIVSDCTLREGEQQPGVVLSPEDKLRLARKLDETGVHQLEVGMPAVSKEEKENIRAVANAGLKAKTIALCRTVKSDIDLAKECGVWGISCSTPIGYLQLQYKMKWSEEKAMQTVAEVTRYAHDQGFYVVMSPVDGTRADLSFLERFFHYVLKNGHLDRVRVVDTVGSCLPQAIQYMVRWVTQTTGLPVEVHCHNDFGMATANTMAGVAAGAQVVSTVVNGMGERAGGAPTEEVALGLKVLYGLDTGMKLEKLYGLSTLLREMTHVNLPPNKAVVGENAFAQEAGLAVSGWKEMPLTAEPYLPELVGQAHRLILGKKSGRHSIELKLRDLGRMASEDQLEKLLLKVKLQAEKTKAPVSDWDFQKMVGEVLED